MQKTQTETEAMHNKAHDILESAGWTYLGCDYWRDPKTSEKYRSSLAHELQKTRDEYKKRMDAIPRPKLILCSDWRSIRNELRKQLKPFGLTVITRGNYKKWGDQLVWKIERRPGTKSNVKDPWNCFT